MTSPTSTPAPVGRPRLAVVAATFALAGLLVACSSPEPVSGAPAPAADEVQFTSDTGLLTINVPQGWDERTALVRDAVAFPGARYEAAWVLSGTWGVDASSFIIASYNAPATTTSELADQAFRMAQAIYPAADVVAQTTLTTGGGIRFERQDLEYSDSSGSRYQVELVAVVDGVGIEIAITLVNDGIQLLDEAITAATTFTMK